MTAREKILISWSGGKDSCLMLHELLEAGVYEIAALVCMVKEKEGRISMHGVPMRLLERQAESLGITLEIAFVSEKMSYEAALENSVGKYARYGIRKVAYGDLFLPDIRAYREKLHARLGLECLFPIWLRETGQFARDFIAAGYKTIVTCVDAKKLDKAFAGRLYDSDFIRDLPAGVDPCGENGEFHTFVFSGPRFREDIRFRATPPILKRYQDPGHDFELGFCDLIPEE